MCFSIRLLIVVVFSNSFGDTITADGVADILSQTPLPATLPLFAGGLGFVGYLTRRKKRDLQAIAAA